MVVPFVNIHTHRKPSHKHELIIRNAFHRFLYNDVSVDYPVCIGYHPWQAHKFEPDAIVKLEKFIVRNSISALGEIGLDRLNGPDMELQIEVFEKQLQLAEKLEIPVIIHCVKAYGDMFKYLKRSNIRWVFHGFHTSIEETRQLLQFDHTHFSFGKNLLQHPNSERLFAEVPTSRIFLETDISSYAIEDIYAQAAKLKHTELNIFKQQVFSNFATVFKR